MKILKIITGYALLEFVFKKESKLSLIIIWFLIVGILLHVFHPHIFNILTDDIAQFTSAYTDKPLFIVTDVLIIVVLLLVQGLAWLVGLINMELSLSLLDEFMQLIVIFNDAILNVMIELPYVGVSILNFSWLYLYIGFALYVILIILKKVFNLAIKTAIIIVIALVILNFVNQIRMYKKYDDQSYLSKDYYESADTEAAEYKKTKQILIYFADIMNSYVKLNALFETNLSKAYIKDPVN